MQLQRLTELDDTAITVVRNNLDAHDPTVGGLEPELPGMSHIGRIEPEGHFRKYVYEFPS
jgi:hypothetical protein